MTPSPARSSAARSFYARQGAPRHAEEPAARAAADPAESWGPGATRREVCLSTDVIPGGETTLPGESSLRDTIRSMTMPQRTGGAHPVSLSMDDFTIHGLPTEQAHAVAREVKRAMQDPARDLLTRSRPPGPTRRDSATSEAASALARRSPRTAFTGRALSLQSRRAPDCSEGWNISRGETCSAGYTEGVRYIS
jgi:hypothetical protein